MVVIILWSVKSCDFVNLYTKVDGILWFDVWGYGFEFMCDFFREHEKIDQKLIFALK